jgi:hypothetical protein
MSLPANKKRQFYRDSLIALCLSLVVFEVVARVLDYAPNGIQRLYLPQSFVDDPILGWKHKPGTYHYSENTLGAPRVFEVTYRGDGARFSGPSSDSLRPFVGLLGCSFVEGFGLDDRDALGARLQERLPSYAVENFGVAGYGTYQSLLTFRQLADRYAQMKGSVVVYGFADFHAPRNMASPLLQRTWQRDGIFPVCDEDRCFYWQGKRMSGAWRMSRTLSLVENALDTIRMRLNQERAEIVTKKILLRLRDEAAERGVRLIIAPMTPIDAGWGNFLQENKFEIAPCFLPEFQSTEFRLSDGHPNAKWMERYGICLGEVIARPVDP